MVVSLTLPQLSLYIKLKILPVSDFYSLSIKDKIFGNIDIENSDDRFDIIVLLPWTWPLTVGISNLSVAFFVSGNFSFAFSSISW